MLLSELQSTIADMSRPVILLEGTRRVSFGKARELAEAGRKLAEIFPNATFRSANVEGADEAIVEGLSAVPGVKLELILSGRGAGLDRRPSSAICKVLKDLPLEERQRLARESIFVSPENRSLCDIYLRGLRRDPDYKKAKYHMRDVLKVSGSTALELAPASVVLLFLNDTGPINGGTARTIQLCQRRKLPVYRQEDWLCRSLC